MTGHFKRSNFRKILHLKLWYVFLIIKNTYTFVYKTYIGPILNDTAFYNQFSICNIQLINREGQVSSPKQNRTKKILFFSFYPGQVVKDWSTNINLKLILGGKEKEKEEKVAEEEGRERKELRFREEEKETEWKIIYFYFFGRNDKHF